MTTLNPSLLAAIAGIARRREDATITIDAPGARRILHVARGDLVGADSTLISERLGELLAAQGRLAPGLLEPISQEARKQGRLLGAQLIHDGLVTPTDLAAALEEQVLVRFHAALTMPGKAAVQPKGQVNPVTHKPLAAALVDAFRSKLELALATGLIGARRSQRITQLPSEPELAQLQLQPSEVRVVRRLAAGETLEAIQQGNPAPERPARLLAALLALELIR